MYFIFKFNSFFRQTIFLQPAVWLIGDGKFESSAEKFAKKIVILQKNSL
jgi:hypothetical protein